ncbi:3-hydroxyacyl-CoA dehydrogenase family protein [Panacibacter ginsenosidivorans]|nr:3-hydroxyacyl-CoA dehydrogenase family protein [Panacibacter ginsenosidivorans]
MQIVVRASKEQKEEWQNKNAVKNTAVRFIGADEDLFSGESDDVYFDLLFAKDKSLAANIDKPVFVHAVAELLSELPYNYIRINAWNGFLKREVVEIVASEKNKAVAVQVMEQLGWKYIFTADIRGMIGARTISMIINEAYYVLGDNVSTKQEIDTAMKLGTNYPYGPFEWSEKIGLYNIYSLLKSLFVEDDRYIVAPYLEQEVMFNSF